jgi:hypothetical protein
MTQSSASANANNSSLTPLTEQFLRFVTETLVTRCRARALSPSGGARIVRAQTKMKFWICTMLGLLTGCGGPGPYTGTIYSVKGQVLLADGTPLTGGFVQFIPVQGGLPASGAITGDGTFSLKTGKSREGAAPGEYKVRIEPSSALLAKKGKRTEKLPFAEKYREYDGNTGLTASINANATTLEPFRLEPQ